MTRVLTIGLGLSVLMAGIATAAVKPWYWTTAQASSALMRQAEDFYVEAMPDGYSFPRDLTAARCRGTGKPVARRFVTFTCTGSFNRGVADPAGTVRVKAKTRRAGGLCWTTAGLIPSGCFAAGKRAEGNIGDAWRAVYATLENRNVGNYRCLAHGAGFFICNWGDATGDHRATITFSPQPVVRVVS